MPLRSIPTIPHKSSIKPPSFAHHSPSRFTRHNLVEEVKPDKESNLTMSPSTWTLEIESPAPTARLFKAFLDWHNLAPKLLPEIFASAAGIQGDGTTGSVRQINFTPAMPFGSVKECLDFVDFDKFECKQTMIEGRDLGKKIESASTHFKFEQISKGGSVCKVVTTYKPLPGVEVKDDMAKGKEVVTWVIKAAEGYLLANPAAYA